MKFTLFTASCTGMESNCRYPQKREIQNAQDLKAAAQFDHVCAAYKNSYRSRDNFLWSDNSLLGLKKWKKAYRESLRTDRHRVTPGKTSR